MLERIFPVGTNAKWHGLPDTISAETRTRPGVCVRQTLVIQAPKLGARIMRYELADYEWVAIKPMLPNKPRGGKTAVSSKVRVNVTGRPRL
jgi:hypothetical protein